MKKTDKSFEPLEEGTKVFTQNTKGEKEDPKEDKSTFQFQRYEKLDYPTEQKKDPLLEVLAQIATEIKHIRIYIEKNMRF